MKSERKKLKKELQDISAIRPSAGEIAQLAATLAPHRPDASPDTLAAEALELWKASQKVLGPQKTPFEKLLALASGHPHKSTSCFAGLKYPVTFDKWLDLIVGTTSQKRVRERKFQDYLKARDTELLFRELMARGCNEDELRELHDDLKARDKKPLFAKLKAKGFTSEKLRELQDYLIARDKEPIFTELKAKVFNEDELKEHFWRFQNWLAVSPGKASEEEKEMRKKKGDDGTFARWTRPKILELLVNYPNGLTAREIHEKLNPKMSEDDLLRGIEKMAAKKLLETSDSAEIGADRRWRIK